MMESAPFLVLLDEFGREGRQRRPPMPKRDLKGALHRRVPILQYANYLKLRAIEQHLFQDVHRISTA